MMNVNFNIKNKNYEEEKNIIFGYIENEEYAIYIFLQKNSKIRDIEILEKLLKFSMEEYLVKNEYSKKNINNISMELNLYLKDYIEENEKFDLNISYLFIITDYNSVYFNLIGDFKLVFLRNDDILFENTNLNYLGTKKSFSISALSSPLKLKRNDKLVVMSNNIVNKVIISEFSDIEEDNSYLLSHINFLEVNEKSIYLKNKNKAYISCLIILFIIIIYILLNKYNIKYRYEKIETLNNEFEELIKKKEFKKSEINLKNQIKNLYELDKIYVFLTKKEVIKKEKTLYEKNKKLEDLVKIEHYFLKINEFKSDIKNREFEKVMVEYNKLLVKIEEYSEYEILENELRNNINELEYLLSIKNKEKELKFSNDSYFDDLKLINQIITEYQKYNISVNDLELVKLDIKNRIEELKRNMESMLVQARILKSENILESKSKYEDIIKILEETKNYNRLDEIKKELEEVIKEIQYNEEELSRNFLQAEREYDLKNYTSAIEYLLTAKTNSEVLKNYEKLKEINSKIKYIKKIISTNKKNNKEMKDKKEEDVKIRNEMKKTIESSIAQGDEYLKNKEYEKAYEEYKRALEIIEKGNFNSYKVNLVKKIKYIKKKLNKNWWEIWK